MLFFFDPTEHLFYPKCALYTATGISCPGCGSLRALHQLTHGHLLEALRLNPGLILALGLGTVDLGRLLRQRSNGAPFRSLFTDAWIVWPLVAFVLLYSLLRNLPFESLAWFTP